MKSTLALLALVLGGSFAAPSVIGANADGAVATGGSAAASTIGQAQFRSDFERSYRVGDRAGMTRLVRDNSADAASWLYEIAAEITLRDDEERSKLYEAIGRAWSDAFRTAFSDRVLGLWQNLDTAARAKRVQLVASYFEQANLYFAKRGEPIGSERNTQLQALGDGFDPIARGFSDLGDGFFASRCWMFASDTYKSYTVGDDMAVPARELEYLKKALTACDAMDVGDRSHSDTKARITSLEAEVARGGGAAGAAAKPAGPAVLPFEFGPSSVAVAEAQRLDDPKKFPRLAYGWDDHHPTWPTLRLEGIGSRVTFPGMVDGPTFEHQGLHEVVLTDADGGSTYVKLSRDLQIVTTRVGRGDAAVSYSFGVKVGQVDDRFHGFISNLQSSTSNLSIFVRPAAAVSFSIGGAVVHVLDDNFDGKFGGAPTATNELGLTGGAQQPGLDSVFVAKSKDPVPFSELMQVGKTWYRLYSSDNGRSFEVAPALDIATGSVRLDYKGAKLDWVVVRGKDALASLFYRLEPGKDVDLPVGSYEFYSGVVRDGSAKALMLPGKSKGFEVTADTRTVTELGAPYGFTFSSSETAEGVRVRGATVRVVGRGGEEYQRHWESRPQPEVHLRKAGSSSWSKVGQMSQITSIDELSTHGAEGWNMVWWPLDGVFENKFGDGVEVRLLEKKNPLFGKIDSAVE